jgi:hypothetical protein
LKWSYSAGSTASLTARMRTTLRIQSSESRIEKQTGRIGLVPRQAGGLGVSPNISLSRGGVVGLHCRMNALFLLKGKYSAQAPPGQTCS